MQNLHQNRYRNDKQSYEKNLTIIRHQEMQVKTIIKYHLELR